MLDANRITGFVTQEVSQAGTEILVKWKIILSVESEIHIKDVTVMLRHTMFLTETRVRLNTLKWEQA